MSNRTLMEFNHDYAFEIEKNPKTFASLLGTYLSHGPSTDASIVDSLHHYGVTVGPMRHHADPEPFVPATFRSFRK